MAVEIPVVVDIMGGVDNAVKQVPRAVKKLQSEVDAYPVETAIRINVDDTQEANKELKKLNDYFRQLEEALGEYDGEKLDLTPYINRSIMELRELEKQLQEIQQLQQSEGGRGDFSFAEEHKAIRERAAAVTRSIDAMEKMRASLIAGGATIQEYVAGLTGVNEVLIAMREYYSELEDYSRKYASSINAIRDRVSELEQTWANMTKYERGENQEAMVQKYIQETTELENEAKALHELAAAEKERMAAIQNAPFQVYIESLTETNFELVKMRDYYRALEEESEKAAEAEKAAAEKALSAVEERRKADMKAAGEAIREQERVNKLYEKGIKSRQYEDAILKTHIQTVRVLSEQQRILSERLQRTPVGTEQYQKLSIQLQYVSDRLKQVQGAASGAQGAMSSVASSSDRATSSINNTNQALQRQSGLWAQLKGLATMYISVFGGLRFMDNIRKTTSELEMQRIALGSIIRDTERANDLFREIKAAALKSPFEIKDLVTYTKQLAAYRIETEDLFKVTTRLADVSAGLGVDMNRLILAYGQVRAASVLRGQELRQFTEAGIPLVEKLAEKFRQLGREGTTTADVFELISQRAVPFRMIEEIFDDMTSAGGEFYKMQELQSETLKGQWMKLKDAVTIMYDEIGNTPQVHKAMEDLIQNALSLTRSWKDVARWIATVGGALVTYAVVSRSAAVASKALTFQEALLVAKEKEQMVILPKLVQKIIGESAAKRLSVRATMRLTAAQAQLNSATTLLTRAFYRLKVAMLSNPYAAIAAGVAALGLAIVTIVKNSQKAEVSIASLEESMAKLQEQTSKTQDALSMIKDYDELSKKADKTADEQKKLDRITKELAKTFPAAVSGIDKESDSLQINIEKVRELTLAEQKLAEQRLRTTAKEAEEQIPDLEKERDKLMDKALKGRKVDIWGGREMLSSEDLAEVEERLTEINDKLRKYKEAIEEVQKMDFIGPMPKESVATEDLVAWKKKLSKIQEEKVKAGMAQIFSPDDIKQLGSVNDLWKKTKAGIQDSEKALAAFKALSLTLTDKDAIEANQKNIEQTEKVLAFWKEVQKTYRFVFGSDSTRDTRLSQLKSDISELTNAYKKFKEIRKYKSESAALIDINELFPQLKGWTPTYQNLLDRLVEMRKDVAKKLAKSPKSKTLLDMQRALDTEISNLQFDDLKDKLEAQLKKISDEMKRSEAARNFYKDLFDMTGDQELAQSLTVSIYGDIGKDFRDRIQAQLDDALSTLDPSEITDELRKAFAEQDFNTILKYADKFKGDYPKMLRDLASNEQKYNEEVVRNMVKALQRTRSFADKRVQIANETAEQLADIERRNIPQDEKALLRSLVFRAEAKQIAQLEYEAFKGSPLYVQMFANLENASERMLTAMRDNLNEVKESWKGLDPTQLKELQDRFREVETQLAKKNPFKTLKKSFEEYKNMLDQGRTREGDEEKALTYQEYYNATKEKLDSLIEQRDAAQEVLDILRKQRGEEDEAVIAQQKQVDNLNNAVDFERELLNTYEKWLKEALIEAEAWKKIADLINLSGEELKEYADGVSNVAHSIQNLIAVFNSEAADLYSDAVSALEDFAAAAGSVTKAIVAGTEGDVPSMIKSIGEATTSLISFIAKTVEFFQKLQLKKWNDALAEQDKLIRSLERSYDKLSDAIENAFGSDYTYLYEQQIKELQDKIDAYKNQLEISTEQSKEASRKQDREAAKEQMQNYTELIEDAEKQMKKLAESRQEYYAGSSLTSAAEEFANSWLEAYREFGDTTEAIQQKMEEMINNLIVKSTLAGAAQAVLKPFFDAIEEAADSAEGMSPANIAKLTNMLTGKTKELNQTLTAWAQVFRGAGVDIRNTPGNFTGIAREYATASEESILALAAGVNTQNFYMSSIKDNVQLIYEILSGKAVSSAAKAAAPATEEGEGMPSVQKMMYDHLGNIDNNIRDIKNMLQNVITTGTNNGWYVITKM